MSDFYNDTMRGLLEAIGIADNDKLTKGLELERADMRELVYKLGNVADTYDGFVLGIAAYARKKPERLAKVMEYMEQNPEALSSDIVKFVTLQEDFFEDAIIY